MPSVRRIIPWTRKPPVGYGLNWSHPLAQGLLAFFPCNEGGGSPVDLCQGLALTKNSIGGTWGQDQNGTVYTTNAGSAGATVVAPAYLQIQPPLTFVWSGNILGTPSNTATVFGITYSNTSTSPFSAFYCMLYSTLYFSMQFSYSASAQTTINSAVQSLGPNWFAGTITSSAQALYVNNPWVAAGSKSQAITTTAYTANSLVTLGVPSYQGLTNASSHSYGLIYNRILSNAELNQLYTFGPWGMIAPAQNQRSLPSGLPGGACTVSMPGLVISGYSAGTPSVPAIRRSIPWTSKPPVGPGLNWSNPLTNGLLAFFPCNEGGGLPVDLCTGLKLGLVSATPSWGQDQNGSIFITSTSSCGAYVATPTYLQIQPPLTLVWSGNTIGAPGNNSVIFGVTYSNALTNPYGGYYISAPSGTTYAVTFARSPATTYNLVSSAISNGPTWFAATLASSSQAIYMNNPWVANATAAQTITSLNYAANSELCLGQSTFMAVNSNTSHSYGLIYNRILTPSELQLLYSNGPWGMIAPAKGRRRGASSTTALVSFTAGPAPAAAGLAISGAYGGAVFPGIISPASGLAISGYPGSNTAGPSPGAAGLAISGAYGSTTFPIISSTSGMAISGAWGGTTAGPSPRAAGMAITGGMGGTAETVTVLLAGLGLSGAPGGATGGLYIPPPTPFYLPYEYTSVPIATGNANPFGIDPEATTVITTGLTSSD
jgi:hypothetical protein